ncbi:MAG: ubiquinol-cytochrome C chaperone [Hyphomicrobiaceae bacterium]|nr:ubiquinol-cytochrome C chaperone [Hyphomicrobiaceae bacterium]
MLDWIKDLLVGDKTGTPAYRLANQLYAATIKQARQSVFYRELGVADTVPGRFEMVSLHMFILLDQLSDTQGKPDILAQQLVDVMFQDMDDVARETGVGDMGVGPRIKKLARSFQSRLEYYKEAIEGESRGTLPQALNDIFFENDKEKLPKAEQLAAYVTKEQKRLAKISLHDVSQGDQLFEPFGARDEGE